MSPSVPFSPERYDVGVGGELRGHSRPAESPSRRRVWIARIVALVADGIQIALLPLVLGGVVSPVDDAIDIATAVILSGLLGFRWAFLPTFLAELIPFVDLAPSWTLAVLITTRSKGRPDPSLPDRPTRDILRGLAFPTAPLAGGIQVIPWLGLRAVSARRRHTASDAH